MRAVLALVCLLSFSGGDSLHSSKYDEQIKQSVQMYWTDFPKWKYYKAQLYQESLLEPRAISYVGAKGLAQFMPRTWLDMQKELNIPSWVSPYLPKYAIKAGAYYMRQLRDKWSYKRAIEQKHFLALASYNTGFGNVLKAQKICKAKGHCSVLWEDIKLCLPRVTGKGSKETIEYVRKVRLWYGKL